MAGVREIEAWMPAQKAATAAWKASRNEID
jgi:hypothetical protein